MVVEMEAMVEVVLEVAVVEIYTSPIPYFRKWQLNYHQNAVGIGIYDSSSK